jgi:hypothetical protein
MKPSAALMPLAWATLLLALAESARASDAPQAPRRDSSGHGVYASANVAVGGWASVNGELAVIQDLLKLRAGYAAGVGLFGTGHGPLGMLHVMNRGAYKTELGLGAFYLFRTAPGDADDDHADDNRLLPSAFLGFRYQPPTATMFWRVGVSSLGVSPGLSGAIGWAL